MATTLRNVRLAELSLCRKGANPGARVVLVKRDTGAGYEAFAKKKYNAAQRQQGIKEGWTKPDGSFPIKDEEDLHNAINDFGRGGATASDKAWIKRRAAALGATSALPDTWKKSVAFDVDSVVTLEKALIEIAKDEEDNGTLSDFAEELAEREDWQQICSLMNVFQSAVNNILSDGDADVDDKVTAIGNSASQFLSTLRERFPDAEVELEKLLKSNSATAGFFLNASHMENDPMTEAEKTAFDKLTKQVEALTKTNTDLLKAGMSADHKAYMAQMPEEKRGDFTAMSPSDRSDFMDKNPIKKAVDEPPVIKIGDTVITVAKAAPEKAEALTIGEITITKADHPKYFDVIKSLHVLTCSQAEQLAKVSDEAELAKLVTKVKAEYPNLPGDPVEKAKALVAIGKVDAKARETLEKQMTAANKAMGDRLGEIGGGGERQIGTAEEQLNTLAKAHAENHKVSFAKAYDHVLTNNPKLYSDYVTEKARAARAA